jgi:2-octaprenyl-6-methoxyphenol hydroxylase
MTETQNFDIIIAGGGMNGLAQALALAQHGLNIAIVERADPNMLAQPAHDSRVSAISAASWNMFAALGLSESLVPVGAPINRIIVNDGLKPGTLEFLPDDSEPMGTMVPNADLRAALFAAVQAHGGIALLAPVEMVAVERSDAAAAVTLDDGRVLSAPLLIAADGRSSQLRGQANIQVAQWSYRHNGIVTTIAHEHPHGNTAYELFYPDGPFAILPMVDDGEGRHRSAIVWTVGEGEGAAYAKLGDRGFAAELSKKSGGFLGEIAMLSARQHYPLGFHHCATLVGQRLALIGDAGHGIHPIAGQGLNLGLRDVATLTQVLVEGARTGLDLGDPQLLARYDRWRGLDNWLVAMATDVLTRLFGMPGGAPSAIRRLGIGAVQRIAPLKARFMAEAKGESGDLPRLLMGELV